MRRSQTGFIVSMFFAFLAILVPRLAAAQDMPPILAPLDPPTTPAPAASSAAAPSAEAVIPPAAVAPAKRPQVAAVRPPESPSHHVATAAENKKFAALLKRLAQAHHEAAHRETVRRVVVVHETRPDLPPGTVVPAPGYYPPGPYYQRLVYAGPYRGWGGFRGPYPYYDHP
jgi:hypothetical protein